MRVARYARVSTEAQADNTSIPNQLARTAAYAEAQGWDLVATHVEPGESGACIVRPALAAVRRGIAAGEYDVLLINTIDRLTRDIDDLFLLRREFTAAGIRCWAVGEGLDVCTADVDEMLRLLFQSYFSHRERLVILERMQAGVDAKLASGRISGGEPAFGYVRGADDFIVVDEPNVPTVRMIYGWIADERLTTYAAAKRINAMAIPSPRGTQWTPAVINRMIRNSTYVGVFTYGDAEVPCPAIIDRATWERANAVIDRNRERGRGRKPNRDYLLKGLIRCTCGYSYSSYKGRGENYGYRCIARHAYKRLPTDKCYSASLRGPEIEEAVWADIEQFIRRPELVIEELQERRRPVGNGIAAQLAEVDRAIAEREKELERCLDLYLKGSLPEDLLDSKAAELRGHVAGLQEYRESLVDQQRRADLWEQEMAGIATVLHELQQRIDAGLDFETKRELVELLVSEILVETAEDEDGNPYPIAHVTYRFEQPAPGSDTPIPLELLFDRSEIETTPEGVVSISLRLFQLERTLTLS